ncbi:MAG: hypothetical protein HKN40_06150 [Winogradskyella sp.]|uniref:hypothetical protein n=1 Tax=Winogradskyella sp. TaxID=1883156 RepID=UPI00180728C1|nr:hypothetical protein [Winogradskyella sp.]
MKLIKTLTTVLILCVSLTAIAQEKEQQLEGQKDISNNKIDKSTYYKQRGAEDAKFEQQFKAKNEVQEKEFWEEQEAYEKDLKKRDRQAYRSYKRGKSEAYKSHYYHCDSHCHHGDYYYHYAVYYYDGYHNHYYYERHPRYRNTRGTSATVRINTPSLRIGF